MTKGQRYIVVDEYTCNLLQRAVDEGNATNLADAILLGISSYLGIRYKSPKERKLEQEATHIMELGKKAIGEE